MFVNSSAHVNLLLVVVLLDDDNYIGCITINDSNCCEINLIIELWGC